MTKRVLVTGASGLVGRTLMKALVTHGYEVHGLSRQQRDSDTPAIRFYRWDVTGGTLDTDCLEGVTAIIHLAGEPIGALPWSNKRKRIIRESRTQSIALLYDALKRNPSHGVRTVISASATGYYSHRGDEWMTEDKPPANGFLGGTCVAWERGVSAGKDMGLRTVSLRSGLVLSADGGIYRQLTNIVDKGLGAVPGSGRQWVPWIHIEDAVKMYCFAMEHSGISGVYNMVAPDPVIFSQLIRVIAAERRKPLWLPKVPAVLLKAVLGQMSELLLSSTRASADKIRNAGFKFKYPSIGDAAKALTH